MMGLSPLLKRNGTNARRVGEAAVDLTEIERAYLQQLISELWISTGCSITSSLAGLRQSPKRRR